MVTGDDLTVWGVLHFASVYPWCCPYHGPLVPLGDTITSPGRGRYPEYRGVASTYFWKQGPRVTGHLFNVVWIDVTCINGPQPHPVRLHYNSTQLYPIVIGEMPNRMFWRGPQRYPVVESLLRHVLR